VEVLIGLSAFVIGLTAWHTDDGGIVLSDISDADDIDSTTVVETHYGLLFSLE
jgi:hypothetical protein